MQEFGVCELSMVPVRKQPSETSEMVNQLLFGDLIKVYDSQNNWLLIHTYHDDYEGWIDKNMITNIIKTEFKRLANGKPSFVIEASAKAESETNTQLNIPRGGRLTDVNDGNFEISGNRYSIDNNLFIQAGTISLTDLAMRYLGSPYMWGGRSPFGIDCSGLIQIIFKMIDMNLKRDASQQAEQGINIDFINESKEGDLAFFDNSEGKIIHVGIILEDNRILHASGTVRIDKLDHHGIFNDSQNKYTHNLRIIKRIQS